MRQMPHPPHNLSELLLRLYRLSREVQAPMRAPTAFERVTHAVRVEHKRALTPSKKVWVMQKNKGMRGRGEYRGRPAEGARGEPCPDSLSTVPLRNSPTPVWNRCE